MYRDKNPSLQRERDDALRRCAVLEAELKASRIPKASQHPTPNSPRLLVLLLLLIACFSAPGTTTLLTEIGSFQQPAAATHQMTRAMRLSIFVPEQALAAKEQGELSCLPTRRGDGSMSITIFQFRRIPRETHPKPAYPTWNTFAIMGRR